MLLYDKDDKLVVASDDEVRLWDFFDHKEEAPELLTMMTPTLKVENIFINKTFNVHTMQYQTTAKIGDFGLARQLNNPAI